MAKPGLLGCQGTPKTEIWLGVAQAGELARPSAHMQASQRPAAPRGSTLHSTSGQCREDSFGAGLELAKEPQGSQACQPTTQPGGSKAGQAAWYQAVQRQAGGPGHPSLCRGTKSGAHLPPFQPRPCQLLTCGEDGGNMHHGGCSSASILTTTVPICKKKPVVPSVSNPSTPPWGRGHLPGPTKTFYSGAPTSP